MRFFLFFIIGGGEISEREARQKLFEKYRRDKITRLVRKYIYILMTLKFIYFFI